MTVTDTWQRVAIESPMGLKRTVWVRSGVGVYGDSDQRSSGATTLSE